MKDVVMRNILPIVYLTCLFASGLIGACGDARVRTPDPPPVVVDTEPIAPAVAVGDTHSLALKSDGTVWTWGNNGSGQLGRPTPLDQPNPGPIVGLKGFRAVSAAGDFSLALKNDGTVWEWGGRPGSRANEREVSPVQTEGLRGISGINARADTNEALSLKGEVWTWQGGPSSAAARTRREPPSSPVKQGGDIAALASGTGDARLVLKADGTVWSWSQSDVVQAGKAGSSGKMVQVSGLSGIAAVVTGGHHAVALRRDGTLWSWGENRAGQLGNGTTTSSAVPVQVVGLDQVETLSAGFLHTVAVKWDGTVWAWGSNSRGQLGADPPVPNRSRPGQVTGLSDVVAVAAGYEHNLAIKRDGTVWAWGWNKNGQLGDGTKTDRLIPVEISDLNLLK